MVNSISWVPVKEQTVLFTAASMGSKFILSAGYVSIHSVIFFLLFEIFGKSNPGHFRW